MTLRRLLAVARGGASFAEAPPTPVTLAAAPSGGWVPLTYPKAVYAGGKTFWGYNAGPTGNVEIRSYTNPAGPVTSATVLHAALSGLYGNPGDDHGAPAILVRSSDSKLLTAYAAQGDTVLRLRTSSSALDASAFAAEATITPGGSNYLYPCFAQLSAESGRIYLFWKDFPGTTNISQTTSTDGGATWSARNRLWVSTNTFFAIATNDVDRIDYVTSDIAPGAGTMHLYHWYQVGGQLYQSDGTAIATAIPIGPSDATLIYTRAGDGGFPYSIVYDSGGNPVVACAEFGASVTYFELRWGGASWARHDITTTDAAFFGTQPPGITHDSQDPNRVYLGKSMGDGSFEMFTYTTADGGATWTGAQITTGSGNDIPQTPLLVKGHPPGELGVIWQSGAYTDDYDYSLGSYGAR